MKSYFIIVKFPDGSEGRLNVALRTGQPFSELFQEATKRLGELGFVWPAWEWMQRVTVLPDITDV